MNSQIFYDNPNISLVLPGPCQAKCDFCFWRQKETDKNWLKKLEFILDSLPKSFYQVSITGGEPTISPFLTQTLDILEKRKKRFPKVVMTTNGINLFKHIDRVKQVVGHVNISHHHWNVEENSKIFGTKSLPTFKDLSYYSDFLGDKLTFNCVIKDMSVEEMYNFIVHSNRLGVKSICFRQEHGSLKKVEIENYLLKNYKKIDVAGCPVCRSIAFNVNGTRITIKYSVLEPKDVIDGVYELIFHSDGKLTADWAAEEEFNLIKG